MQYTLANLREANDYVINKAVKYPSSLNSEIVSLAKEIYQERNLDDYNKQIFIAKHPRIKQQVTLVLQRGEAATDHIDFLVTQGYTDIQAKNIVNDLNSKVLNKATFRVKESTGSVIWSYIRAIVLLIIVIKAIIFLLISL